MITIAALRTGAKATQPDEPPEDAAEHFGRQQQRRGAGIKLAGCGADLEQWQEHDHAGAVAEQAFAGNASVEGLRLADMRSFSFPRPFNIFESFLMRSFAKLL